MSTETPSAPAFRYVAVTFDCADPAELARFYGDMFGLAVTYSTDDFVFLGGDNGTAGLGFTRVPDYRRPTWPDPAQGKQAHIEVGVDDLDTAEAHLLARGAVKPDHQPQPERWRVLLDPAGHPFCITTLA
ncbi:MULTISPECIES: VOC family protein [Streptomyces]|uniref:VOC family protein n=1 Tax=Streptomyces TaxID=1883 RepID=UPI0016744BF7|nr:MULTISPECIES: VOC family protein [Streptomyces]MBK3524597.1 VOC family protein [Streptomyces sp. MBT70]GGS04824.1 glyoxalase [Streptomyces eurythermus]